MNRVFAAMIAGHTLPMPDEDVRVASLAGAFRESAAILLSAFALPGALDRSYTGPLGSATGQERLQIRLYDLLTHGWDIATAIGRPAQLPDDCAADSLLFARHQLTDDARPGRFAPVQPVHDHAPAIEQLAAFLGRTTR